MNFNVLSIVQWKNYFIMGIILAFRYNGVQWLKLIGEKNCLLKSLMKTLILSQMTQKSSIRVLALNMFHPWHHILSPEQCLVLLKNKPQNKSNAKMGCRLVYEHSVTEFMLFFYPYLWGFAVGFLFVFVDFAILDCIQASLLSVLDGLTIHGAGDQSLVGHVQRKLPTLQSGCSFGFLCWAYFSIW